MTPIEPGYPKEYTIAFESSSSRVVGVYSRADVPESPHRHNGGILVHCASPIEVFSFPDKTLIYKSEDTSDTLAAAYLPKADLHYSCTPKDYSAVFIEITARAKTAGKRLKWQKKPKESTTYFDGCWKVVLHQDSKLKMGGQEGFAISQCDLTIYKRAKDTFSKVLPIPKLPYKTYHLEPGEPYIFEKCPSFVLVER